jgi:hypothetical protein
MTYDTTYVLCLNHHTDTTFYVLTPSPSSLLLSYVSCVSCDPVLLCLLCSCAPMLLCFYAPCCMLYVVDY